MLVNILTKTARVAKR